jgi:bifunctional non-homologous end joining protein LigD
VVDAAERLRCKSAIIDGEMVALDEQGRSDFTVIKSTIGRGGRGLAFFAFDLLFLRGVDLRAAPIEYRRDKLRRLVPGSPESRLLFSHAIFGDGAEVFAGAEQLG